MMRLKKSTSVLLFLLLMLSGGLHSMTSAQSQTAKRRVVRIFLDLRETNLEKPSTIATNTLSERLATAGFRVTTRRGEAELTLDGTISSRLSPVTEEVKKEGGVNAEATGSLRLLAGGDVIATSVERSAPGDWGVQPERLGEDRLIEVAGLLADDMFTGEFVREILGGGGSGASGTSSSRSSEIAQQSQPGISRPVKSSRRTNPSEGKGRRGVSFLELISLVQNYASDDRIVAAINKYGIKFKPAETAIGQLRSLGASDAVINAIKKA